ncbi:hypothetical protein [Spelaeicoccus albus]|uniref:Uncharacterized protein n=1 Tax=Spelaeicoccus albus TaxID=1280376 RepID=A0A7Z0D5C0_9MICO|nr:hypothetical protein [Spelaeicoccus albus]NYI69179.1 hypothetical protein [Spelaeicoccus albus]
MKRHRPSEWFAKGLGPNVRPRTWEGWLVSLALVVVVVAVAVTISTLGGR